MKTKFSPLKNVLSASVLACALFASCSDDNPEIDASGNNTKFQLAFASGSGSISGTYVQGVDDVTTGTISFQNAGSLISTGRTSRIFHTDNGKHLYSLTYQAGTVDKFVFTGSSNYSRLATIDASVPLGNRGLRFYKLNEEVASLSYVSSAAEYEADGTTYKGHKITGIFGTLDLATMQLRPGFQTALDIVLPGPLKQEGYNITRVDCPVLSNGKLYFGAAVSKWNPTLPGTNKNTATDKAMTLVIDYPSLTNATVIETTLAVGATNGYRTPTQQVNEAGEVYQLVSGNDKVSIVKLVNGQYHTTYKYSLDGLLSKKAASNGFFYVGNGIAYIPYEDRDKPQVQIGVNPQGQPSYSSAWGIARMDLINNTVVDLEVPDGLWLTQWQNAAIKDGKIYFALSPVGAPGHIYIFDVNSTSPQGTKGAATVSGADQYFIGIY